MKTRTRLILLNVAPAGLSLATLVYSSRAKQIVPAVLAALTLVALVGITIWMEVGEKGVTHHVVDVPTQGKFVVPAEKDTIYDKLRMGKPWEAKIQQFIVDNLEVGDNMIDVGAHIGSHIVPAAQKVGSGGTIYAFEPMEKFRTLTEMALVANKLDNVIVHPFALGASSNTFVKMEDNHGKSKVVASNTGSIPLRTLDSYIDDEEYPLPTIKLIKIDVEGFEYDMLEGASALLLRDAPIIVIEIWPGNVERVTALLQSMGPSGYTVTHYNMPDDFVAVPN